MLLQAGQENQKQKLQLLREYVAEQGVLPRASSRYQGSRLGEWCKYQRERYSSGQITKELQEALEAVALWSWQVRL